MLRFGLGGVYACLACSLLYIIGAYRMSRGRSKECIIGASVMTVF